LGPGAVPKVNWGPGGGGVGTRIESLAP